MKILISERNHHTEREGAAAAGLECKEAGAQDERTQVQGVRENCAEELFDNCHVHRTPTSQTVCHLQTGLR